MIDEIEVVPQIFSIDIENKGIIKKANISFNNGLNIIIGKNGSGKTTCIKEIENQSKWVKTLDELKNTFAAGEKIMFSYLGLAGTQISMNACFLIDNDDFGRLDKNKLEKTLKGLAESKNQIIITMNSVVEIPNIKANIIDTDSFDLN